MARRPRDDRPNYHRQVVEQLVADKCLRMEPLPNGAFRWHSERTGITFMVEAEIRLSSVANEILRRAGLPPILKG